MASAYDDYGKYLICYYSLFEAMQKTQQIELVADFIEWVSAVDLNGFRLTEN